MKQLSVAVVGAGMGGLATTAALRRAVIEVAVYEQARCFARVASGIQIGCNAMNVPRGPGLEAASRAGGRRQCVSPVRGHPRVAHLADATQFADQHVALRSDRS